MMEVDFLFNQSPSKVKKTICVCKKGGGKNDDAFLILKGEK